MKRLFSLALTLILMVAFMVPAAAQSLPLDPVTQIDATAQEGDAITATKLEGISIPLTQDRGSMPQIDFAAAIPFAEKDNPLAVAGKLASGTDATRNARAAVTPYAGQYTMDPNLLFTHSLTDASDYNMYICAITQDGWATGVVLSDTMDYAIGVAVYDSAFNLLSEDYSSVPKEWYSGQRVRTRVRAGQYVALLVQANGAYVPSTYNFAVVQTLIDAADIYERNDRLHDAMPVGVMSETLSQLSTTNLDHSFDVDWYTFTFNHENDVFPGFMFKNLTSTDLKAALFRLSDDGSQLVSCGTIVPRTTLYAHTDNTPGEYYMAVFSTSGSTGNYSLGFQNARPSDLLVAFTGVGGDEGTKSFAYGSKPAARYWLTGHVLVREPFLLTPIANQEVIVRFRSEGSGSCDVQVTAITDKDGFARFSLSPPPKINAPLRFTIGDWKHYYGNAVLEVSLPNETRVRATQPWYWYTGLVYVGP